MENINYLRISLTDKCNLNCMYCTPVEKSQFLNPGEILSYEEMARVVSLFVKTGVRYVRLTGGEPLLRKDIIEFIKMLKEIKGLEEITMTTNGVYLKDMAVHLKKAGLDRINISLDTLKKERFRFITGFDCFDDVWQGIEKSLEANLYPVKLNVILMKTINDDEIFDFVQLSFDYPVIIRFIEFFPTNKRTNKIFDYLIKSYEVKNKIISRFGIIEKISGIKGNGPAEYYSIKESKGLIGFINGWSKNFCNECNRLRINCAGEIFPCLFSGYTHDIRPLLRSFHNDETLLEYIKDIFKTKSRFRKNIEVNCKLQMSSIGG